MTMPKAYTSLALLLGLPPRISGASQVGLVALMLVECTRLDTASSTTRDRLKSHTCAGACNA